MVLGTEEVTEQVRTLPGRDREDPKAEIDDVDGASLVQGPAVSNGSGKRHLTGGGDEVLLDLCHFANVLGADTRPTKYGSTKG